MPRDDVFPGAAKGRDAIAPYQRVLDRVAAAYGVTWSAAERPALRRAVGEIAARHGFEDVEGFGRWLDNPAAEPAVRELALAASVGETYFFRHPEQCAAVERRVLPALLADAREEASRTAQPPRLRVWSAGCASGEEAHTLAILLWEAGALAPGWRVILLGTDLHEERLAQAREGTYSRRAVTRVALGDARMRHFVAGDRNFRLHGPVAGLATFARHNLAAEPPPLTGCDLVTCRNVLVYFSDAARRRATATLVEALRPGGFLLTGHADGLDLRGLPLDPWGDPGTYTFRKRTATPAAAPIRPRRPQRDPPPAAPAASARPPVARPTDPPVPDDLLRDATAALSDGRLADAERALRACLFLDPSHTGARFLLATTLERLVRSSEAAREFALVRDALATLGDDAAVPGSGGFSAGVLRDVAHRALERLRGR